MASLGRNDPCPCGSGRKYKRCCLGAGVVAVEAVSQQDREIVFGVLDELVDAVRYQDDVAQVTSLLVDGDLSLLDSEDELMSARVVDWLTLDVVLRRRGGTIAADALRRRSADLPPGARRFLRDLMGAPLRLMQVDGEDDEVWRDLVDQGVSYRMSEANELFDYDEVVVARIVERDGFWIAEDIPAVLLLDDVDEAVEEMRRLRRTAEADGATPDIVRMVMGAALLRLVANAEIMDDPPETQEGDLVSPTISTWDVDAIDALAERLDASNDFRRIELASVGVATEEQWEWWEAPLDGDDPAPLARVMLRPGRLETGVASQEREVRVRRRLHALAGDLIRYIGARSLTPDDLVELADRFVEKGNGRPADQ